MPKQTLSQKIKETIYRNNMRKAMQKASREELQICLEEVRREIEKRNTK